MRQKIKQKIKKTILEIRDAGQILKAGLKLYLAKRKQKFDTKPNE